MKITADFEIEKKDLDFKDILKHQLKEKFANEIVKNLEVKEENNHLQIVAHIYSDEQIKRVIHLLKYNSYLNREVLNILNTNTL